MTRTKASFQHLAPQVVGLAYTLVPGRTADEAGLRRALAAGETQACTLTTAQRPEQRFSRLARPFASGLGAVRRVFGWGGRALKGITGADQAQLRPRFAHGSLGWSLSVTKRF